MAARARRRSRRDRREGDREEDWRARSTVRTSRATRCVMRWPRAAIVPARRTSLQLPDRPRPTPLDDATPMLREALRALRRAARRSPRNSASRAAWATRSCAAASRPASRSPTTCASRPSRPSVRRSSSSRARRRRRDAAGCRATRACCATWPPPAILEALAGLSVTPDDARARGLPDARRQSSDAGDGAQRTGRTGSPSTEAAARRGFGERGRWRLVRSMATDFTWSSRITPATHAGTPSDSARGRVGRAPRSTSRMAVSQVETNVDARRRGVHRGRARRCRADHARRVARIRTAARRVSAKTRLTCPLRHGSVCALTPRSISTCASSGVRPDGYHELRTIFQTIDLHDIVTVESRARARSSCDGDAR